MFPYDSQLLAAVDAAMPQTMADVLGLLHSIDALCVDQDGLKWFNRLYTQVTQAVADRVAAPGGFADPVWFAKLDVEFAKLYFHALGQSISLTDPPESWQVLFEARDSAPVARVQFALAGINAHINRDLAVAIVNTCLETGTVPGGFADTHYRDFTALTARRSAASGVASGEHARRL